jgi:ATP-binding cassette subfamily F protein uup
LNVLEDYLKSFSGCVVVVSHDRFFMDKIVDHLFVFEGDGKVTDFPGNYTIYRNKVEIELEKVKNELRNKEPEKKAVKPNIQQVKTKLSFKEQREFELLGTEIEKLDAEKIELENSLNSGKLPHEELFRLSENLVKIKSLLDEKELRWLELSELT